MSLAVAWDLMEVSDGAAGLIGAVERVLPRSLRQRCLIHRVRNLFAKIPQQAQDEVKAAYWRSSTSRASKRCCARPGTGGADPVPHRHVRREVPAGLSSGGQVPAVRPGLADHLSALPAEHHPRIRHSNFIERTFGETCRRTKVIGRLPGEASCLSLVRAVLDRASRGWRGLTMTPAGLRLLQDLRRALLDPPTPLHAQEEGNTETTTETLADETVGAVA